MYECTALPVGYVTDGSFNVVRDEAYEWCGQTVRLRVYVLKQNPDQRQGDDISHSVAVRWAASGMPRDAVFHLGRFYRTTVVQ